MAKENNKSPIVVGDISVTEKPTIKAIPKTTPLTGAQSGFTVKAGWYHLVKVDKNGNEIIGTDMQVSQRDYNRVFSKRNDYAVKKSPVQ